MFHPHLDQGLICPIDSGGWLVLDIPHTKRGIGTRREGRPPPGAASTRPGDGRTTMSEALSSGRASNATRWLQLIVGIICMSMIANLQYGWTLFVAPIDAKFGWGPAPIPLTFPPFPLPQPLLRPSLG